MNFEERLDQVALRYREQGYQVVVRPGPDDLPPFAKDFRVEILAARQDGNVIVSAKRSTTEFEEDPNLSNYAEIIGNRRGWRYDVFVLGPEPQAPRRRKAKEASEEEIARFLDDSERIFAAGFSAQAFIAAWAAMESAMRFSLRSQGSETDWETSARTILNEMRSSGGLSNRDFRELERLLYVRNDIVQGFSPPDVTPDDVSCLVRTARQVLADTQATTQTSP